MRYGDIKYHNGSVRTLRPRRIHTYIYVCMYIYIYVHYICLYTMLFVPFFLQLECWTLFFDLWREEGSCHINGDLIHYDAIEWCIPNLQNWFLSRSIIGFIYCILYLICYRYWKYIHMPMVFVIFNIVLFVHKEKENIIHFVL